MINSCLFNALTMLNLYIKFNINLLYICEIAQNVYFYFIKPNVLMLTIINKLNLIVTKLCDWSTTVNRHWSISFYFNFYFKNIAENVSTITKLLICSPIFC